ncbi:hypothetical protein [Streptomyces sp. YGL11-2]|uniref:hypothetical protein n=1 Tax=Streptomyces sp. YGL11-2 TaxID=3414028 RepID=UPI003CF02E24
MRARQGASGDDDSGNGIPGGSAPPVRAGGEVEPTAGGEVDGRGDLRQDHSEDIAGGTRGGLGTSGPPGAGRLLAGFDLTSRQSETMFG